MGLREKEIRKNSRLSINNRGLKIRTATGFVPFYGVADMGVKQLYRLTFDNETSIEVTEKHIFFTLDGQEIQTADVEIGTELLGITNKKVTNIEKTSKEQTFDIIESETHTYFANGLLCHNCQFLSSDALLIDSLWLANQTPIIDKVQPVNIIKDVVFWEEVLPGKTYLIGVDPATGNGEDFSVITIYDFPSLTQVAEYRSNSMSTNLLYGVLKNILIYLEQKETTVYFSVENNGVGEGIIALFEADEDPPMNVEFVSEEGSKRRGMTTTSRTKMRACINLKEMLEKGNLHIKSRILLTELKSFARKKGSYAAQLGSTDDAVSALLIVVRLIEEIASYDQSAFDKLYSTDYEQWDTKDYDGYGDYDDDDEGLPVII